MRNMDFGTALGLLAAIVAKQPRGRRSRERHVPQRGEPHFIETASGTIYHVDAKGTRRRATEAQITEFRAEAAPQAEAAAAPDQRPCIHHVKPGEVCPHPDDAPIHQPAEGCTADGGRCDYPNIHHAYRPAEVSA